MKRIEYGLDKHGSVPQLNIHYSPGYSASAFDTFGTITTSDHHSLVTPFIINDQQSTGIDFRVKGINENLPTISTCPSLKLVMPFFIKEEHSRANNVRSSADSLQTQTTRQSMAIVIPQVAEFRRTGNTRPVTEPLATITAGGNHHGLITDESLNAFIQYIYGQSDTKPLTEALGTLLTKEHAALVTYRKPNIDDCFFRMLKPSEIQLGMAFDSDYVILGSGKDKVKQCGNAVTPPVMEWLLEKGIETLN
jgi:DNA (cytosine-5)-methyltransferase 1